MAASPQPRARFIACLLALAAWLAAPSAVPVAGQAPSQAAPRAPASGLTTYHVQGNVWVIAGAGGNITVQASDAKAAGPGAGEGVLLVDTGRKEMTAAVLAEIQKISPRRIEYIVTTHVDADHVGGNETFAKPRMDFLWTPGMVTGAGVKVDRARERAAAHEQRRRRAYPVDRRGRPTPTRPRSGRSSSTTSRWWSSTRRRRAPTATAWCSSAARTSSAPATSFSPPRIRSIEPGPRRQPGRHHQRPQPAPRSDGAALQPGGRHLRHSRSRPRRRSARRARVPRHAGDRARPRPRRRCAKGQTLAQVKAARPTLDYDARWGARRAPTDDSSTRCTPRWRGSDDERPASGRSRSVACAAASLTAQTRAAVGARRRRRATSPATGCRWSAKTGTGAW